MADQISLTSNPTDNDEFSVVSRNGWNRFSKFLLVNVVAIIAALLLIGAFTVWS